MKITHEDPGQVVGEISNGAVCKGLKLISPMVNVSERLELLEVNHSKALLLSSVLLL